MQTYFYQLSDLLQSRLSGSEMFTVSFAGETSNFVRFNKAKVRQPGTITQQSVSIRLIQDGRHASISVDLSGSLEKDTVLLENVLAKLRERLPYLPQDPHLLINQTVSSSERIDANQLIPAADMVDQISTSCSGLDMVGILASGSLCFGFSNSLGQRNWFSTSNFNLDWSLVYSTDKAVKSTYAGREWSNAGFASKMEMARKKLQALAKPAKKLQPGQYRVFLTPEALWEILSLMNWGGFSLQAQKNKISPLLKLYQQEEMLSPQFSLCENVAQGASAQFQSAGFLRPSTIPLIEKGRYAGSFVSPRSAKEYGEETNGAEAPENADSMDLSAGSLPSNRVIETLGEGVYIGNLWYLNYSDRLNCRMTGMTRFATFWVENGEVAGPVDVMRFDDTVYRMLGSNLEALTAEREFLLSASSYFRRSTGSARLPGALINDFSFTL